MQSPCIIIHSKISLLLLLFQLSSFSVFWPVELPAFLPRFIVFLIEIIIRQNVSVPFGCLCVTSRKHDEHNLRDPLKWNEKYLNPIHGPAPGNAVDCVTIQIRCVVVIGFDG